MPTVHDSSFRTSLETRVRSLRAGQKGRWGKMSIDQMLWHVNVGLSMALGEIALPAGKAPLPRPIMKFLVLDAAVAERRAHRPGVSGHRVVRF